jgi:predicted ArsR family transcriptional regulator
MESTRWDQRFFSTTRGQIVSLLRRASRTVDELAGALGLTDNAVRSHLTTLERDGLVAQEGVRRGVRKPSYAYQLTPAADALFPKAFAPVLQELLRTVDEQLGPEEAERLVRSTGRRLAAGRVPPNADETTRLEAAAQTLNELGGLVEIEERDGDTYLQGYSCPLGAAAQNSPQLCQLAESLVSELVGRPVQECCDRGQRPRCCFRLAPAADPSTEQR